MTSLLTAILSIVFAWCLLYGAIPAPLLVLICAGLGTVFIYYGRRKHPHIILSDDLAQNSRMRDMNPTLKFFTLISLIITCVASKNVITGIFLAGAIFALAIFASGLSIHDYIHIITLPTTFLLIGGFALLVDVSDGPLVSGVLNVNLLGLWVGATKISQARTALIISRAFGAFSCLCLLSATTPMSDIIGVMKRMRCPNAIIDVMYLMYRYIFILFALHRLMRDAAKSRLGYKDYKTSLRSTGMIYANLLARSYQFAESSFDAMESRCFESGIRFLEHRINVTATQIIACSFLFAATLCLSLLPI